MTVSKCLLKIAYGGSISIESELVGIIGPKSGNRTGNKIDSGKPYVSTGGSPGENLRRKTGLSRNERREIENIDFPGVQDEKSFVT